jgi:hypothetical protein
MNAAPKEESAQLDTILNYATEEDLDAVREIFLRGDALQADVVNIQTALVVAARNLEKHQFNATDRIRNAAARALGESVPAGVAMSRT